MPSTGYSYCFTCPGGYYCPSGATTYSCWLLLSIWDIIVHIGLPHTMLALGDITVLPTLVLTKLVLLVTTAHLLLRLMFHVRLELIHQALLQVAQAVLMAKLQHPPLQVATTPLRLVQQ
jgi:hypothetical protein